MNPSEFQELTYSVEEGVALVTLNRPEARNAVNGDVARGMEAAIDQLEDLDLVTQDMLIGQTRKLEQFQWFVRAHLESPSGKLSNDGASTEKQAAKRSKV